MLALRAEALVVRSEDHGPWRRPYAAHTTNKRRLALQDAYVPRCRRRRCLRRPRVLLARVRGPRASLRPVVTGAGHGAGDTQSLATADAGNGTRGAIDGTDAPDQEAMQVVGATSLSVVRVRGCLLFVDRSSVRLERVRARFRNSAGDLEIGGGRAIGIRV